MGLKAEVSKGRWGAKSRLSGNGGDRPLKKLSVGAAYRVNADGKRSLIIFQSYC